MNPKLNIELTTNRYTHLEVDAVGIFVIKKSDKTNQSFHLENNQNIYKII